MRASSLQHIIILFVWLCLSVYNETYFPSLPTDIDIRIKGFLVCVVIYFILQEKVVGAKMQPFTFVLTSNYILLKMPYTTHLPLPFTPASHPRLLYFCDLVWRRYSKVIISMSGCKTLIFPSQTNTMVC